MFREARSPLPLVVTSSEEGTRVTERLRCAIEPSLEVMYGEGPRSSRGTLLLLLCEDCEGRCWSPNEGRVEP